MLDSYSRRHEAQKIYLRQQAVQRWIGYRDRVLNGERPHAGHSEQLAACDAQLRNVSIVFLGVVIGEKLTWRRNSRRSQMMPFILICALPIIRCGAGRPKILV